MTVTAAGGKALTFTAGQTKAAAFEEIYGKAADKNPSHLAESRTYFAAVFPIRNAKYN